MAKKAYIGIGDEGVACQTKKIYIGVDDVARIIKKAYVGVDGVARLCYQAGVEWRKYNCKTDWVNKTYYKETDWTRQYNETYPHNDNSGVAILSTTYNFNSTTGEFTEGTAYHCKADELAGKYWVSGNTLYKYDNHFIIYDNDGQTITGHYYDVYSKTSVEDTRPVISGYSKGDTDYGSIYADEGALPEDGALTEGSANGDYCILLINSTRYYYERV